MISRKRAEELISNFKRASILVIGDLILDKYLWGEVERISPEAPVPVVDVKKETVNLGGACNVAWNISSLEGNVYITGVIGNDEGGRVLEYLLKEKNINSLIVKDPSRPTTEKTRVLAVSQQLMRIDRESREPIEREILESVIGNIDSVIEDIDVVIVSDYGKGVITEEIMDYLRSTEKPVFVDPKPSNRELYHRVTTMTPNKKEAYQMADADKKLSVEDVGRIIMDRFSLNNLLITLGAEGMALFTGKNIIKIPAKAKKVFDVTGAGDTVISVLSLSRAAGGTWEESASLANYAAGYVVGEIGTAVVNRDILLNLIPEE